MLEIGPGTGNLTVQLLEKAKKVIAVEYDRRMVAELHKRVQGTFSWLYLSFNSHTHSLTHSLPCMLPLQPHTLSGSLSALMPVIWKLFTVIFSKSNYHTLMSALPTFHIRSVFRSRDVHSREEQISSPLVFKLLAHRPMFRSAILMFQREFAMRMVARPSDPLWCRLSINCQLLAHTSHVIKVGRNCFRPPPKVESSVIRMDPRNPPPPVDFVEWDGLIRLAFSRRHKTMGAIFRQKLLVDLLEQNYKTYMALQNKVFFLLHLADLFLLIFYAHFSCQPMPNPLPDIKELAIKVLEENEFAEKRAATMDIDDFLMFYSP